MPKTINKNDMVAQLQLFCQRTTYLQIQKLNLNLGAVPVFDALMTIHKSETDLWPKFDVSMSNKKNCLKLGFDSSRT
jgi:hypothetical protein